VAELESLGIIRAMYLTPLTRIVGRTFFRVVRRFPFVFVVVAVAGLVLGYCCIFVLHDDKPSKEWFLRCLGIGCLFFYGGLLVLLIHKICTKKWADFCDWAVGIFE
jgi:hypothetical protein